MRLSIWRITLFVLALIAASAYALSKAKPDQVPEPVKPAQSNSSNIKSFEFLGCSGDWSDEKLEPQAWRAKKKGGTIFLIKHPADCGYTIGSDPKAQVIGSTINFSYAMSNDSGELAACFCEYWASFELKSVPEHVSRISINGEAAELKSDLAKR